MVLGRVEGLGRSLLFKDNGSTENLGFRLEGLKGGV